MLHELSKEYDALFIATGMHKGKKLGLQGEELKGVVEAIDFLREVNLGKKVELGDRVAVICVHRLLAIDAARVALRLGPKEVNVIYRRSRKSMLHHRRMGEQMQKEVEKAEREGAKTHFISLQAAWDKNDLKDIAEYTTPELYAALQNERLNRGEETHFTEVVTLNTELVEVQREGDEVVASVLFSGLIREEQSAEAKEFTELWHVVHPWDSAEGDWHIAGIQQVG